MSFAVLLFTVANGAVYMQKSDKLGLGSVGLGSVLVVGYCRPIAAGRPVADALYSHTFDVC